MSTAWNTSEITRATQGTCSGQWVATSVSIDTRTLAPGGLFVALKGAQPELKEKILANMSSRAAATLREDLESRGPMRLSEVEAQQKEILKVVRRLADEGTIVLSSGGGDDAMV